MRIEPALGAAIGLVQMIQHMIDHQTFTRKAGCPGMESSAGQGAC
jgi:hypothetical protein